MHAKYPWLKSFLRVAAKQTSRYSEDAMHPSNPATSTSW